MNIDFFMTFRLILISKNKNFFPVFKDFFDAIKFLKDFGTFEY